MKLSVSKTLAASAVTLLLSGCGGGSGNTAPAQNLTPPEQNLQLSGTAATGLALVNSAVEVKCATGSGTATTDASGTFTVTVADGSLPCMIQVTGEADGVTIVLHSVTEAGTGDGATTAVANVTPLTEMIVAQLTGTLPSELFQSFSENSSTQITGAKLASATTAVVDALKLATGIDLGSIDPFKSPLVAATAGAPDQGNSYDQLLDVLKTKVSNEALPLIVNQIAAAAGTAGASAPVTLDDIMTSVEGGSLAGCPAAVSGKYRTIDYWGRTFVRQIDFKTMKINRGDNGLPLFDITADPERPCEFTAAGTVEDVQSQIDFVIGPTGAGGYRGQNLTAGSSVVGYIFPVQAHTFSSLVGTWTFLQSGFIPGDPVQHFPGQLVVDADRSVVACDFNPANSWACEVDDEATLTMADGTDGGFSLVDGEIVARVFGYRAPNGSLTVFGTTNPAGANDPDVEQTSFVAGKFQPLALPALGTANRYWNMTLSRVDSTNSTSAVEAASSTVTAVDSADGSYTRERLGDGLVDTIRINRPFGGVRFRDPGTWNGQPFAGLIQFPFPGLGITASINGAPSSPTLHLYSISVARP